MNLKLNENTISYKELIILAYFLHHYKKYNFSHLTKIMGMTYKELEVLIDHLLRVQYLKIYDNYLVISRNGENILEEYNMSKYFVKKSEVSNNYIHKEIFYVPIDFKI